MASSGACPNSSLRTGASVALPDCRAYEQVSPQAKGGFNAYPTQALPAQVSSDAANPALAYLNFGSYPGAAGNSALYAGHISSRTAAGWVNQELTPATPEVRVLRIYLVSYAFSDDLSQAVLQVPLVPLTSGTTPGAFNLFLRRPAGEYSLINNAQPAMSTEELCGPSLASLCFLFADVSTFAGAASDFSHILFESDAKLTPESPSLGTEVESLYESREGHVALVGILPDGKPATTSTAGAGSTMEYTSAEAEKDRRVERAISNDGSHVLFQAPADGGLPDEAQAGFIELYDRINGTETIEISAPVPGATIENTAPASATYAGASSDGSRVFFTSAAELTSSSKTGSEGGEDLYEYDLTSKTLTDLTVDSTPADSASGASVQGVVDESADGSYVYFVAKGQLDPGRGVAGEPNLYLVHDGAPPVFIATLNNGTCKLTSSEAGDQCVWTPFPGARAAYVTPDGRHLAFMSDRSLPAANFPSGYDNRDQSTGEPDKEVYEYAAPSPEEEKSGGHGELLCGSCDSSGTRPIGSAVIGGISLAANGGVTEGRPNFQGVSTPFYRVRALSDDGSRLFYTASVPHEAEEPARQHEFAGPPVKVREYEADGEGSCVTSGGCQYLISAAHNAYSDEFLGASADGTDVYFATAQAFGADTDELIDIYDARAGGGFPETLIQTPCEANCRPEQLDAPPSTPLVGASAGPSGNIAPQTHSASPAKQHTRRCSRGHVRKHGRCIRAKRSSGRGSRAANRARGGRRPRS